MTPSRALALLPALALVAAACGQSEKPSSDQAALPPDFSDMTPTVVLETTKGTIVMELDRSRAPKTVDSVVRHVQSGFYDGLIFHRVMPGFMIQAGGFTATMAKRESSAPELVNEADNGLKNVRGSVAMARTSDPHSAKTQFFINLVDNPALDHTSKTPQGWGYAVFGRVIEGMDVVDAIARTQTTTRGPYQNVPVEPIVIERAYLRTE